jgi:hypothetical protein
VSEVGERIKGGAVMLDRSPVMLASDWVDMGGRQCPRGQLRGKRRKRDEERVSTNLDERRPSSLLCLGDNIGTYSKEPDGRDEKLSAILRRCITTFPNRTGMARGEQGGFVCG